MDNPKVIPNWGTIIYIGVCVWGGGGLRGLLLFRLRLWLADASCIYVFACACGLPTRAASPPLTYSMVGELQLWGARTAIGGSITFSWWACERQLVDGEVKRRRKKLREGEVLLPGLASCAAFVIGRG